MKLKELYKHNSEYLQLLSGSIEDREVSWILPLKGAINRYLFSGQELCLLSSGFLKNDAKKELLAFLKREKIAALIVDATFINNDILAYADFLHLPLFLLQSDYKTVLAALKKSFLSDEKALISIADLFGKALQGADAAFKIKDFLNYTGAFADAGVGYWHILSKPLFSEGFYLDTDKFFNAEMLKNLDSLSPLDFVIYEKLMVMKITVVNERYAYLFMDLKDGNIKFASYILTKLTAFLRHRVTVDFVDALHRLHLEESAWLNDWFAGNLSDEQVKLKLYDLHMDNDPLALFIVLLKLPSSMSLYRDAEAGILSDVSLRLAIGSFRSFRKYGFKTLGRIDEKVIAYVVMVPKSLKNWHECRKKALAEIVEHNRLIVENLGPQQNFVVLPDDDGQRPCVKCVVGKYVTEISEIGTSYKTANYLLEYAEGVKGDYFAYDDLYASWMFINLRRQNWFNDFAKDLLKVFENPEDQELLKTLKVYYAANMNKNDTAKALNLSRQALYGRLKRIAVLIGEDFDKGNKRLAYDFVLHYLEMMKNDKF